MLPGKPLPAREKAGEIASAQRAAIGFRPQPQHKPGSQARMILLVPSSQLLPVAFGATRVLPIGHRPNVGSPTMLATPASQSINSHPALEYFTDRLAMGKPNLARAAFWAGGLHSLRSSGPYTHRIRGNIALHIVAEGALQTIHRRVALADI